MYSSNRFEITLRFYFVTLSRFDRRHEAETCDLRVQSGLNIWINLIHLSIPDYSLITCEVTDTTPI